MFHKITIYFVGGTSVTYSKCDDETATSIMKWLEDDELKIFRLDTHKEEKKSLIRKELVLFVDID